MTVQLEDRGMEEPRVRSCAYVFVLICCCWCLTNVDCVRGTPQNGFQEQEGENPPVNWRLLTNDNFTSELEKHEFSLFIATSPWCGKSRSLMKGIRRLLKEDPRSFCELHLFFAHTNKDRSLGQFILGDDTPGFTLFRYGTPYKYNGRCSASSIMASIRQGIPILRKDMLFQHINSFSELETFTDSTDKAVVLFDFCGFEQSLNKKQQKFGAKDSTHGVYREEKLDGNQVGIEYSSTDEVGALSENACEGAHTKEQQGRTGLSSQNAGQNDGFTDFGVRFDGNLGDSKKQLALERTIANEVDDIGECIGQAVPDPLYCVSGNSFQALEDGQVLEDREWSFKRKDPDYEQEILQNHSLCSSKERELFESVYHNLSQLAANSVLTPQRARFGVVTDEEIASQAGIMIQARAWLLMYQIHDFDQVPYFFYGDGDVEAFLSEYGAPLVIELEEERHSSPLSALLNDTLAVILFIDRMSNSQEIREKSKEALHIVRALSYHYASIMDGEGNNTQRKKLKAKGRQIIQQEATDSALHVGQRSKLQMVESNGLLTLKNSNLMGRLQNGADGRIVVELIAQEHQSISSVGAKDPLHFDPSIHLSRSAMLKILEEKVRQVLSHPSDPFLLPLETTSSQSQEQEDSNYGGQPLGHHNNGGFSHDTQFSNEQSIELGCQNDPPGKVNSLDSFLTKDEHTLGAAAGISTDGNIQLQNSAQTKFDMDSTDIVGGDTRNEACALDTELELGDVTGSSRVDRRLDISSGSRELIARLGLLQENDLSSSFPSTNLESSQTLTSNLAERADEEPGSFAEDVEVKLSEEDLLQFVVDKGEETDNVWNGLGFYFIDGEDHLKERVTMCKTTPSLVVIDPAKEAHYIFPVNRVFSLLSLINFVDSLMSGELRRTILSQPELPAPRQPLRPPFVNRDFHEIHAVPRVTVGSFSKLVTGLLEADDKGDQFASFKDGVKKSDTNGSNFTESVWEKDVLVLFTTPWCGFCKRMELVVREVYRYFGLVKELGSAPSGRIINSDKQQDVKLVDSTDSEHFERKAADDGRMDALTSQAPVLLQMDCTMNDCSDHLRGILEEETYPAVVLFPARNKVSPVVYNGAPTVSGLYDFLKVYRSAMDPPKRHTDG